MKDKSLNKKIAILIVILVVVVVIIGTILVVGNNKKDIENKEENGRNTVYSTNGVVIEDSVDRNPTIVESN